MSDRHPWIAQFISFFQRGLLACLLVCAAASGCARPPVDPSAALVKKIRLTPLRDQGTAAPSEGIQLSGAGNEWVTFTIAVNDLPPGVDLNRLALSVTPLKNAAGVAPEATAVQAYQLIDMPVDSGRAEYVRHVGQSSGDTALPRALVPLKQEANRFSLASLRSTSFADGPAAKAKNSAKVWFDLRVAKGTPAGTYTSAVRIEQQSLPIAKGKPTTWSPVVTAPIEMAVHNFTIPDQRALKLVGQVNWDALTSHYQGDFEAVSPHRLHRSDAKYAVTIKRLDALMALAQQHRVSLVYPQLEPIVKWPANINNAPPDIRWEEFDSVVTPWLSGAAFADGIGVGYWPLPEYEHLQSYDSRSRMSYWSQTASHFDQKDWLSLSSIVLRKISASRQDAAEAIEMSMEAAQLLASHPRLEVTVPLQDGQIQVAVPDPKKPAVDPAKIDALHIPRLRTSAPGLIAWKQDWPAGLQEPRHALRADLLNSAREAGRGAFTAVGGEERDIRLWAWLAFLRRADQVKFAHALPTQADKSAMADPSELIWFYPGEWFGLSEPVPTVQLKALRAAEQDYEYLHLARQRGETINPIWMARLLTKPVEIGPGQMPDPSYSLMTGTADARVWADARKLLVKMIELRSSVNEVDAAAQAALEIEILQWARPQERPILMGRSTDWNWFKRADGRLGISLSLGLDIYNASEIAPGDNQLRWGSVPPGYERTPTPTRVNKLETYRVARSNLVASLSPDKISPAARLPLDLELQIDSPTAQFTSPLKLTLPVAGTDRRQDRFIFDGRLEDWEKADLIHDGPLVKMLSRPTVLAQAMEPAATKSQVYTNWHDANFYVGFAVEGLSKVDAAGGGFKNFVDYQARRAWGEDLCQVLIQPVYADNALGPILHVVCKPNGSNWVERKLDPRMNADPWESFEGTGTRYAAQVNGDKWTGEVAIPWKVLDDKKHGRPTLLRFNFTQHRSAFGESASWAGPVDFGRDDSLTGLLYLKYPLPGQPGDAVQGAPVTPGTIER